MALSHTTFARLWRWISPSMCLWRPPACHQVFGGFQHWPSKSPGIFHVLTLSECKTWYTVQVLGWLPWIVILPHVPWHAVDEHIGSKLSAWAFYVHHVRMSIKMLYRMVWKLSKVDDMRFDWLLLALHPVPSQWSRGMLHRVAKGDQFLPEWSNPNGTLLDREVAEVD